MSVSARFPHLLSPGQLGTLAVRNRIVMTPMGSNLAEPDGTAGERIQRYYEARAEGGVGMVVVGVAAVAHPSGACNPNQLGISADRFLPGLRRLVERVHAHGARIALQLQHAGKVATRDIVAGRPMWVPSIPPSARSDLMDDLTPEERDAATRAYRSPGARMAYHEMTEEDVATLISWFATAAARAKRAGFDGVELHAGHGYLLAEFLSPHSNRRKDAYGGPLENRARLLVEVIRAVREHAGEDFPLWCRLDGRELRTPDGITLEDAVQTARIAEAAGLDAIHVSAYADPAVGAAFTEAPLVHEPCGFVDLAAAVKQAIDIPVIAVGRIAPDEAEALLAAGSADFVAMGRKLLADPQLPRKLEEDRPEDVRPCIYCYTCVSEIFLNRAVCCAVRPATGRESALALRPAAQSRRVLVVGGGPAGMEAARVAARRGHRVTLCERHDQLGGWLALVALPHPEHALLAEWLERQIRSVPIDLQLGVEVTPELVDQLAPDIVLVATGTRSEPLAVPGADDPHVRGLADVAAVVRAEGGGRRRRPLLARARGADRERPQLPRELARSLGQTVAILGGGGLGLELARWLGECGREVSLLESADTLGVGLAPARRWRVLAAARQAGVGLHPGVEVCEIAEATVVVRDAEGSRSVVKADTVWIAGNRVPDAGLASALQGRVPEVRSVGGARAVGTLADTLLDASEAARAL